MNGNEKRNTSDAAARATTILCPEAIKNNAISLYIEQQAMKYACS